jgi:chromosome segregation ATPase
MSVERLDALETRIRDLVKLVQELKKLNAGLEAELRGVRDRLKAQEEINRRWERERTDIRTRVEKVLGEIEVLEGLDESKEVALG